MTRLVFTLHNIDYESHFNANNQTCCMLIDLKIWVGVSFDLIEYPNKNILVHHNV